LRIFAALPLFCAPPIGDEKIKCKYIQSFYLQSILLI
jgi:hypothetical protein